MGYGSEFRSQIKNISFFSDRRIGRTIIYIVTSKMFKSRDELPLCPVICKNIKILCSILFFSIRIPMTRKSFFDKTKDLMFVILK